MCGIAGFFQTEFCFNKSDKWLEKLSRMKETLGKRGPNENGLYIDSHIALAHTRLSIQDIDGGVQPMKRSYLGRSSIISYNGEIYNCKELKAELKKYDVELSTHSDTEIILYGYLVFGTEIFAKLNGIFAIAIYDEDLDILILARDHVGIKPLFYTYDLGISVFASEPKALFAYGIKPTLSEDSLRQVIGLGPARTPGNGVFKGVKEVLPGHFLVLGDPYSINEMITYRFYSIKNYPATKLNSYTLCCPYWKLKAKTHTESYEETIDHLKYLVTDAITRQLISDVEICTFLSGGLDSSLVTAICAKEFKKLGKKLSTYSFEFVGNKENFVPNSFQASLDGPYVEKMVNHCDTNHKILTCNNDIMIENLYTSVDARDMPNMADVESSLIYFCSEVSKNHAVALTGECADEIFGGYPWFHKDELLNKNHFPWGYDIEIRECMLHDDLIKELYLKDYTYGSYLACKNQAPLISSECEKDKKIREITWLNIAYFMSTLLNRMDRTSMYNGLEARVPFADKRIIEYVYNIPWDMKCKNNIAKNLLVEVAKDYLPNEVLYRKKSPYPKTYDPSYENKLRDSFVAILNDNSSPIHSIIDKKKAMKFMNSPHDYGSPWYGQLMAGPQMIAYMLQINYWMKKYGLTY